jgi:hypothetical protein
MKGCCLGFVVIALIALVIGGGALAGPQITYNALVSKYGDEVMTRPAAAAATGLTLNQLIKDREQAKKERGDAYKDSCDPAWKVAFFGSSFYWYVYAQAALDPAGRDGSWGKQISQKDWDRGYVPVGDTTMDRAMFDAMVALYWHTAVLGAPASDRNCGLRAPKPANGGTGF